MSLFTRTELEAILSVRQGSREMQGEQPYLEFRIRMTPEILAAVMDGYFVSANGTKSRLESIYIDEEDLATPNLTIVEQP